MGKLFAYAFGGISVLAIIVGIYLTGGPMEARHEARDEERLEDMAQISEAFQCFGEVDSERVLPEVLTVEALRVYCGHVTIGEPDLRDSETGALYEYKRISDTEYAVCAEFHNAEKAFAQNEWITYGERSTFYPEQGCVKGRIR